MGKSYLERKEAWAARVLERGEDPRVEASAERLPPGQHWVDKLPVLDLGIHPTLKEEEWELVITGQVEQSLRMTWGVLQELPKVERTMDFHCVTTWSVKDCTWSGVALSEVLDRVRPAEAVTHVLFTGSDGYTTQVEPFHLVDEGAMLATHLNGEPLSVGHGGPVRVILPKLYAWKGAKWVREMEFQAERHAGYWEKRGYSDSADPWTNDRFARVDRAW